MSVLHETLACRQSAELHKMEPQEQQVLSEGLCEHAQLMYHADACCELKTEIAALFSESKLSLADLFSDAVWHAQVVYLTDVFEHFECVSARERTLYS